MNTAELAKLADQATEVLSEKVVAIELYIAATIDKMITANGTVTEFELQFKKVCSLTTLRIICLAIINGGA